MPVTINVAFPVFHGRFSNILIGRIYSVIAVVGSPRTGLPFSVYEELPEIPVTGKCRDQDFSFILPPVAVYLTSSADNGRFAGKRFIGYGA